MTRPSRIFPFEMKIGSFAKVVSSSHNVELVGTILKRDTVDQWSKQGEPYSTWTNPAPGTSVLVEPLGREKWTG